MIARLAALLAIAGCGASAPPPVLSEKPAAGPPPAGLGYLLVASSATGMLADPYAGLLEGVDLETGSRTVLGRGAIFAALGDRRGHDRAHLAALSEQDPTRYVLVRFDGAWRTAPLDDDVDFLSPDGTHAIDFDWNHHRIGTFDGAHLVAEAELTLKLMGPLAWLPDGRVLMVRDGHLTRNHDPQTLILVDGSGAIAPAGEIVAMEMGGIAVSADGTQLAWEPDDGAVAVAPLADLARTRRYELGGGRRARCVFAAGDRRLVCEHRPLDAHDDVALDSIDLATGTIVRIADDAAETSHPIVSPDGARVAFAVRRDGGMQVAIARVDRADVRVVGDRTDGKQTPIAWLRRITPTAAASSPAGRGRRTP